MKHPSGAPLLRRIRAVRTRARVIGWGRVLFAVLVPLAAAPLCSTLVLPWLPREGAPWGSAVFLLIGVCVATWMGWREFRLARPQRSVTEAAALLGLDDPGRRELLVTGADLATWETGGPQRRGVSAELVRAQIDRAAVETADVEPGRTLSAAPLWRWSGGALLAAALLGGWWGWDPGGSRQAWARLFLGGDPPAVTVGNISVRYVPPAYTERPPRTIDGADGAIRGLPGTRVTLQGRTSRSVDGGTWHGPGGGGTIPLQMREDHFEVSWILQESGTYHLAFFEDKRSVASNFSAQAITVETDRRPDVQMPEPAGDLEVTTDQEVRVRYAAEDDFRIERVELVAAGDVEVRIPLAVTPAPALEGEARFLPLSHPELGEGAHLRVEAWDNDTVSGPKAGVGPSVYVSFLDKRRLLADIEDLEERLFHALLTHLADHLEWEGLESGPALAPLRRHAEDLLRLLDRLTQQVGRGVEEGALAAVAVLRIEEGLRAVLNPFAAGTGGRDAVVPEVELDILFLDRLLQSLRMEQALSIGDELTALQRDLFDALQEGSEPQDLLQQVDRLQELLAQMAARLSRAGSDMPDAFANADAVQEMPQSDLQQMLQELRQALQQGDREAAQRLAEQLVETLSQWMAALEEAAQSSAQGEMDPLLQELLELEQQTSGLIAGQEELLEQGRRVGQQGSDRARQSLQEELQSFLERQEERLRRVDQASRRMEALAPRPLMHGGAFHPPQGAAPEDALEDPLERLRTRQRVGAAVTEVREALREDLSRARAGVEALEEAVDDLSAQVEEALREQEEAGPPSPSPTHPDLPSASDRRERLDQERRHAQENLAAMAADLEALAGRGAEALTPEEREELGRQAEEQAQLAERAEELAEQLQELAGKSPLAGGEKLPGEARAAKRSMRGAGASLGEGDPFAATPQQGQALEHLSELSQNLQQARQQVQQGMQGSGMQMVRSPGRQPGGGRDVDRSRVEIPQETEARELRLFREEVLRAMREGDYPEAYREDVKRYYEGLIR